ncbi:MAG: alpha/beta fold hydrolase [Anaerolineales bacterium]|nr:alpha/beta fold hydrolase [Anaerolineales bacterium]
MSLLNSGVVLFLVVLTLILFVPVYLGQRRRGRGKPASPRIRGEKIKRAGLYTLRLVGFAIVSLVVVFFCVTVFVSYQGAMQDMEPAPSQVEAPADLPFTLEEVTFQGEEDLTLAGWYVPPQNGATVILLHGYGGNRTQMLWQAEVLVNAGYGVLLYDERASGESEGDHRSFGWEDPADVAGALDHLNALPETDPGRIGIAGCSIGGQIALQGAVYSPQIGAVWADGPSGITTRDLRGPRNWFTLIGTPANYMVDWFTANALDRELPRALIDIIGEIEPRPVMLVAGGTEKPLIGAESMRVEYYAEHAGLHTQVWIIPEATHCDGPIQRPEEYAARMVDFFDAAFGITR